MMRYAIRNKMHANSFWCGLSRCWVCFESASAYYFDDLINIMLPTNGVWVAL
jgi:hypothetical protein